MLFTIPGYIILMIILRMHLDTWILFWIIFRIMLAPGFRV